MKYLTTHFYIALLIFVSMITAMILDDIELIVIMVLIEAITALIMWSIFKLLKDEDPSIEYDELKD